MFTTQQNKKENSVICMSVTLILHKYQ